MGKQKAREVTLDNDNCKKSQKPVTSPKNLAKIPRSTPLDLVPCQPACLLKQVVGEQISGLLVLGSQAIMSTK